MDIAIRKALPEDASEYTACHISCWKAAYRGIISDEYFQNMAAEQEQRTQSCKEALSDPGIYEFYCAICAERIIGRLIICKSRDEDKPGAGEIAAIYLIEDYWDKGYGGKMMQFAIEALKRTGYNEVILWVLEENSRARLFYEKWGFVFDGTIKEIQLNRPLIEMRYTLKHIN